jgi:hypothetical protein
MNLDLYIGVTHFNIAPNGIWYQEAFPHEIKRNSPSFGFDLISSKGDWQYGAGYLYVGKASVNSLAVADDANYDLKTNTCVDKCLPLSHWHGQGNVQQAFLFARRNYSSFFLDVGIAASRPSWSVDIPDYRPYNEIPAVYKRVEHKPKLQFLPTFAVGIKDENITYKLSLVPTVVHGEWIAIYRGASLNFSIGKTIK